jgi:hypothetical protein
MKRKAQGMRCGVLMAVAILVSVFALPGCTSAAGLKPFTTDGCSLFPEGTPEHKDLWLTCCTNHDLAYWMGGTSEEREKADQELKACVDKTGEPAIAQLMLAGVRVGGTPYLPTPFRWGYGWSWPRGYQVLNDGEWEQVKTHLSTKQHSRPGEFRE